MKKLSGPLNSDEFTLFTELLWRFGDSPTRMPVQAFYARLKAFTGNSSEIALLRHGQGGIEIYLTKRPDDDPFFPGQWHGPGCMILNNEKIEDALKRMMVAEVGVDFPARYHRIFEWPYGHGPGLCPRGHTVCFYYSAMLSDEQAGKLKGGRFFPINDLPNPMVEVHTRMIGWLAKELSP